MVISELAASNQEDSMDHARQILATLTEFPWLVLSTNSAFVQGNLANLHRLLPTYATFGVIETNGQVFCSATLTNSTPNLADRSYFQRVVRTKKFAVGDFQIGRLSGKPCIDFGYPVFDDHGALRRILLASLEITNFYEALKDIRLPAKGILTVLDRSGNVVARYPHGGNKVGQSLVENPAVKQILAGKTGTFEMKGSDGVARLYAVTPAFESQEPRLFVMVEVPLADLFAPANRALVRNIAVLTGLAILLYLGAGWYARYFFVNPIRRLAGGADRLAAGDLTARIGALRGPVELAHLARALDVMAGAVQERADELLHANQSLRKEMAERERAQQEAQRQAEEKKKLEEQF
ncbi:MAG: cache domain-containing protein, partial [Limisphaerales bacterium]